MKKKIIIIGTICAVLLCVILIIVFHNDNNLKFDGNYPFTVKCDGSTAVVEVSTGSWKIQNEELECFDVASDGQKKFTFTAKQLGTETIYLLRAEEDYKITVTLTADEKNNVVCVNGSYVEIFGQQSFLDGEVTANSANCAVTVTISGASACYWGKNIPDNLSCSDEINDGENTSFNLAASKDGEYTAEIINYTDGICYTLSFRVDDLLNIYLENVEKTDTDTKEEEITTVEYDDALEEIKNTFGTIYLTDDKIKFAETDGKAAIIDFSASGDKDYLEILAGTDSSFGFNYDDYEEKNSYISGISVTIYTNSDGSFAEWTAENCYRMFIHNFTSEQMVEYLTELMQ